MQTSLPHQETSTSSLPKDFRIGDAVVQPELNRIVFNDRINRIELKTMQVLVALASQPGTILRRAELLARVWPKTFVSEDVLNRAIYRLRKVLRDDPKQPRHIETVPKIGYRLLIPVEPVSEVTAEGEESSGRAAEPSSTDAGRWKIRFGVLATITAFVILPAAIALNLRLPREPARGQTHIVPLLAEPGHQTTPRLSPDGSRIAYADEDAWDGASSIMVRLVDGAAPLRLTSGYRDTAPVWSPDGLELIWFRYHDPGRCELWRASYLGGDETLLTECPTGSEPPLAWSPDRRRLAFCALQSGHLASRIWELTLDSGNLTPLTTPPSDFIGDGRPRYSSDGRTMAFVRSTVLGAADVHLLDLESGATHQLTHDGLAVSGLDFTPDGQHVVFLSPRGGDVGLWQVPVTGGGVRWVGFSRPSLSQLSVAAAGNRMAVTSSSIQSSIWQHPLRSGGTGTATQLIASSRYDRGAEFSPDQQRVAWVSDRSGSPEIWLASATGGELVQATDFGGPQVGPPRWSPDGERLLFEVRQRESADLFALDVGTRAPRRIPSPGSQELAPRWSVDGRRILFASNRSGAWQVWRQTVAEEGGAEQVTFEGGFAAIEAADGTLFYTKMTDSGIWMRRPDSDAEQQLTADLPVSDWTNWTLSTQGVIYMRRPRFGRGNAELLIVDIATGESEHLADLGLIDASAAIALSPSGDRVIYGRNEQIDADIYLLDHLL